MADEREQLGRIVRDAWVAWASEQPDPKPSWLAGWDELDEGQREADMRIGEAVAAHLRNPVRERAYMRAYMDVQAVLDKALGTGEEDGAGAGIAADVALLLRQRDRARREAAALRELVQPGLFPPPSAVAEAVAAERERIVALADSVKAVATADEGTQCFFADLIRDGGRRVVSVPEPVPGLTAEGNGPLLDPSCRRGEHAACLGAPCECPVPGVHAARHGHERGEPS